MKRILLSLVALLGLQAILLGQNATSPSMSALRMGKLPSGLSYYICPTEFTPGKVHLYLLQNIGSVLEEDKQQGMAHFMEHLSFNTSQHFPGGIMPYLLANSEWQFNATTGINETNYSINNIPSDQRHKVDSALLILRDWVEGIRITPEAIAKERNIILEEKRQRDGVERRLSDAIAPSIYNGSAYAYRNTIGQEETLRAFSVKDLEAFRKAWYRPEMQAIMIIGDIKPEVYEAKLRELFKSKASKKPLKRQDIVIEANKDVIATRFVDAANVGASMGIYQRITTAPQGSRAYILDNLYARIFDNVVARRLARLRNDGREEFIAQTVSNSQLVRGYEQIAWDIVPYSGRGEAALKQALAMRELFRRAGLSREEFEAEQSKMLEDIKGLMESDNLDSPDNLMGLFKANYLYGTPIKSVREELSESYEALTEVEVEDMNTWLKQRLNNDNLAFVTYANRPEELNISLDTFTRLLREVKQEPLLSFAKVKEIKKMADLPIKAGKIVKEGTIPKLETKEWTLSNGAKMLYKYVPELKGQFYFVASSLGGRSAVEPQDLPAFIAMRSLLMKSGLGDYSRNDIHQWLQGKDIELSLSIENYNEGIGGNAPREQAQNFFEYLYMVLMKQNFSPSSLTRYKDIQKYLYNTRLATKRGKADEEVKAKLYPYSALNPKEDNAFYDSIKHEDILRVYAERMLSARDFTFCILGDLPEIEARRLTEQYIASLPEGTLKAKEGYKILDFSAPEDSISWMLMTDFESNVGEVELSFDLAERLTEREEMAVPVLEGLLQARLFEELREREQGVYSTAVSLSYEAEPQAKARLNIHFNTESSKVERMKARCQAILAEVAQGKFEDLAFKQALMPYALSKEQEAQTPEENPLMWLIYLNAYVETGKVPELNKTAQNTPDPASLKKEEVAALMRKLMGGKVRDIVLRSSPSSSYYLH